MRATKPLIHDVAALDAALSDFDRTDLLSAVAGLQLLPENAERVVRLEALAYRVGSGQSKRSRKIAPHTLRDLCNNPALGTIAHAEDPFDSVFCEEVLFHGGSYRVLPGINEHATFILKRILESLFFHRDNFPDRDYVRTATRLIHGTLAVSERICAVAGVKRNPVIVSRFGEDVVVPDGTHLTRLKSAVRFSREAFITFLRNLGLPVDCLQPLTVVMDSIEADEDFQIAGLLTRKPIVTTATDVVVASPTELLSALRNALVALAQDRGVTGELAERFGSATWQAVREHLSYVDCDAIPPLVPEWEDKPKVVHEGFFSIDTDKVVYCLAVTDSLSDYDRDSPFGLWETPGLTEAISERLDAVMHKVYANQLHINEIFALMLTQSVGRFVAFGIGGPDLTMLALPAADLCTLCLLEGGKRLVLWQFARVRALMHAQAHISPVGVLDEYEFYRKNRYTYYATDEYRPNVIGLFPGGAGTLRREVFRLRDSHGVSSYRANDLIEVTHLHSPDVPVYVPSERLGSELALVVEGLPTLVWITGPDRRVSRDQKALYSEFVDAIAYWLWQFSIAISPVLQDMSSRHKVLRVIVELNWMGNDLEEPAGVLNPDQPMVVAEAIPDAGIVVVRFEKAIEDALSTVDNAGERLFMRELLLAIRKMTNRDVARLLRDHALTQTMDSFAPLGLKKKIFFLSAGNVPQLDSRGLPHSRYVQEVEKNLLLDPIGDHFRHGQHFAIGPIERTRIPKVINDIVSFCYREFTQIVASLSPEGLIEWLVVWHESNVHSAARAKLLMATRIACFGQSPEYLKEISEGLSEASEAAVAGRFLIEYVAARPPKGFRAMSLSVYDALLSRAAIITTYGMLSDIVYFDIARVDVDMLGAGRLGFRPDQYRAAMQDYRIRFAATQATHAADRFRRQWQQPAQTDEEWKREVEEATQAEFGFPLSKLVELLSFAIEMGLHNPPIVRMKYADVVVAFAAHDGWNRQQVEVALELFLYRPRENFLKPGNGYRDEDAYPWRYGRRLSYLRRPFLVEESEDTWLIWGHRHVKDAHLYLLQTCFGGRMQASSEAMKALVSRHANREGEAFNDEVADLIGRRPSLSVHRRLKKIGTGSTAIQPPGDIDVLVIDLDRYILYVLECKNLAFARTPFELAAELRALTESTPQYRSMIEKHHRRVAWLKTNLVRVLVWAKLDPTKPWQVRSAVVVDEHAMSPKLRDVGEPVFSINDLRKEAVDYGLEALCTAAYQPYPIDEIVDGG